MRKKKTATKISDLKRGVEKKEKTELKKAERQMQPKTNGVLNAIRIIFWLFVAFVIVVGIRSILISKQPKIVENIYKYEFLESESEAAKSFALSFATEYLTYGRDVVDISEYRVKMANYMSSGLMVGHPEYANGSSVVKDAKVWSVETIDENRSNIVVQVDVELTNEKVLTKKYDEVTGEQIEVPTIQEKRYFLSVPIYIKDAKIVVNDYPAFVPVQVKSDQTPEFYQSENVANDSTRKEINQTLTDFFDVYYTGSKGQIKSFFKEDQDVNGMDSAFIFDKISEIFVYAEDKSYVAIVTVEILQSDLNASFNQRYLIRLERTEDRWMITELKNRGI